MEPKNDDFQGKMDSPFSWFCGVLCLNFQDLYPSQLDIHWGFKTRVTTDTVDGRNPAPPGMYKTL